MQTLCNLSVTMCYLVVQKWANSRWEALRYFDRMTFQMDSTEDQSSHFKRPGPHWRITMAPRDVDWIKPWQVSALYSPYNPSGHRVIDFTLVRRVRLFTTIAGLMMRTLALLVNLLSHILCSWLFSGFSSPLDKDPCPKLAAITSFYMTYYDLAMLREMVEQGFM